jgi:hypothetical protein
MLFPDHAKSKHNQPEQEAFGEKGGKFFSGCAK